ncbi:MAG TPA: DUF3035 domain-containing protein [Stellaceae bacterium]|jgi:hypothetical protein|nr:DUF3035 domain-containing protein [Stellaceae bacterium]
MELRGVRVRSSFLLVAALGVATLPLGGCDSFNRAIGKTRVIPDEFQVVSNAPLAIPPDYTLRPPRVGSGPEQANPTDQARETVFRAGDTANGQPAADAPTKRMSAGEQDLLKQAGATNAAPDIRRTVDADPTEGVPFERGLVDKLLFWSGPTTPASNDTLNPGQESSRIRVAQSVTKPGDSTPVPADAPVPTFEHGQPKKSGWFSWF